MRWIGRRVLVMTAVVAALAPAVLVGSRTREGRRGALLERAAERLELTDEQRQRIRALYADHRAAVRSQFEALGDRREAQRDAMRAQPFDEARLRAAAEALGAARADLVVTRARIAHDVRAVLTPEQVKELDEMLDDYRALRGATRERFRRPRDVS
jgi:Spy/CpxP family protein refolding chaperone